MLPIKDLLDKIKWDKREDPEVYILVYIDLGERRELPYIAIKRVEGSFMIVEQDDKEAEIPMHRVRQVKKAGVIMWERKAGSAHSSGE